MPDGVPLIPFDLGLDGTGEDGTYHGPWNLLGPPYLWECPRHRITVPAGGCPQCKAEADEHSRTCGPSMSCPWWRAVLGWEGV